MIDFLDMDSNKMVISEFYENDKAGKYDYSAVYQRDKVWSEEKKSFLIDSILKNYPIPPVFLRMKIDPETGVTKYDVIDGKQRLTTIRDYIDCKISLPDDFGDDKIGNSELNGTYFSDLDRFDKYKRQLWHYRIPVIFIETDDNDLVKNVFDRLNRNGEPLVPQELRHAQYGETILYKTINVLAQDNPWKEMLNRILETERMEDREFISELLFVILENKIIAYTKESLDDLYKKWASTDLEQYKKAFMNYMNYVEMLDLPYEDLKINKVSHLYAVWILSILAENEDIDPKQVRSILIDFYERYNRNEEGEFFINYKKSMSSNTKGTASRNRRVQALVDYCKQNDVNIINTFSTKTYGTLVPVAGNSL